MIKDRPEPPVIEQAVKIVGMGGRIVVHGIFEAAAAVDFSILVAKEAQIMGSLGCQPEDTLKAIGPYGDRYSRPGNAHLP